LRVRQHCRSQEGYEQCGAKCSIRSHTLPEKMQPYSHCPLPVFEDGITSWPTRGCEYTPICFQSNLSRNACLATDGELPVREQPLEVGTQDNRLAAKFAASEAELIFCSLSGGLMVRLGSPQEPCPTKARVSTESPKGGATLVIAGSSPRPSYARSSGRIGRRRTRLPVAAKIALHSAGATGGTVNSPAPVGGSSLGMMCTSTAGISWMRNTG
jgi:hypothetical protein